MEDQNQKTASADEPQSGSDSTSRDNASGQDVLDELSRLGTKLVDVVESAWSSDERKRIEAELKSGLSSVVDSIEEGLDQMGKSEQTKEFLDKAEDAAASLGDKVRESEFASDMASGLLKGLRALSAQIDKVADEFQSKKDGVAADPSEAREIPIEKQEGGRE